MKSKSFKLILITLSIIVIPVLVAFSLLHLWRWHFSVPLAYGAPGADEVWQLVATKTLLDTGWVLTNPYLGAPAVSEWYNNSGAQTSALHSVFMLAIGIFVKNSVAVQQVYFILNFAIITFTGFLACRAFRVARLPAILAGLCFSFTSYRIHSLSFAYLANYFIVPLSIIPSVWILQGKFVVGGGIFRALAALVRQRRFWWSLVIVCIAAVTDGYYAFFTLLILGFATLMSFVVRDHRNICGSIAPCALILAMFISVSVLDYPIHQFRATHPEQADQDKMKQPTDAEVYSPSLKLLIAPLVDHRVPVLATLGRYLVDTANFNRKFPYTSGATVILGLVPTGALFAMLIASVGWSLRPRRPGIGPRQGATAVDDGSNPLPAIGALALFVLLCSLSGGIGSLIAIVFPSIRAYDRFPIYIIFLMYFAAAYAVTPLIETGKFRNRLLTGTLLSVIAVLAILDQVPSDLLGLSTRDGRLSRESRFLAERAFVSTVENRLEPGALVYQYPYSQYLTNNKYYGWGAFGQLRLYLHSKYIHWSNGNAKDSPGDYWHERLSSYPLRDLVPTIEEAGFTGFIVDRLVVPDDEYAKIKETMVTLVGVQPLENDTARLAFWQLPKIPYIVSYDSEFKQVISITIFSDFDIATQKMPESIDSKALTLAMHNSGTSFPVVFSAEDHPAIFKHQDISNSAFGLEKIKDIGSMNGDVTCDDLKTPASISDKVKLKIINHGTFDWDLGEGDAPLRIAANVFDAAGKYLGDISDRNRLLIKHGESVEVLFSLYNSFSSDVPANINQITVKFGLLQEGNAWFARHPGQECSITVVR